MSGYTIKTLGCKVNRCDSSAMGELLEAQGYTYTPKIKDADVIVVNTCAVTAEAERKSRQTVRRAIAENPNARVIACGCAVQRDPQSYAVMPGLFSLQGTGSRKQTVTTDVRCYTLTSLPTEFEELPATTQQEHTRAFIKVQEGCNNFCSYCVIPYLRGKPRSRTVENIRAQAESLMAAGYGEIVLTGINLAKYGRDLPEQLTLSDALKAAYVPGVRRLRLGSLEPEGLQREFFERLKELPVPVCPHFHVSLQSGCTRTLSDMNRHYTAEEYKAGIKLLREYYPQAGVTTDVIVGFPGETERDFEESMAFVQELKFSKVHVFPYSDRPGTKASAMEGHIAPEIMKDRAKRMGALAEESSLAFYQGLIGQTRLVLAETPVKGMPGYMEGLGEDYSRIWLPVTNARGRIIPVKITQAFADHAVAELID